MFYKAVTQLIEDVINNNEPDFALEYVDNGITYKDDNLISKNQVMGVVNLISSQVNSIKTEDGERSRTDVYTIRFLVPLNSDSHKSPGYYEEKIQDFVYTWDNQEIDIEDCKIFTSNCQIITMAKTSSPINGNDYEEVVLQFQAVISETFVYGNTRVVKIDNQVIDCVIDVIFGSKKQYNSYVNEDGIIKNQNCGLAYSLTIDFVFNKNNIAHQELLADWMLTKSHQLYYKVATLVVERNCDVAELTTNDITGDIMKVRAVFVESGV